MKLRNLFALPILASLMLVGGCKKTPVQPEPDVVDPAGGEGEEGGEGQGGEEEVVVNAEAIATAFNENLAAKGFTFGAEFYDIEGVFTGWYLGVNFSDSTDESEENLGGAASYIASFLPESMLVYDEGYTEATETAGAQYAIVKVTEGFEVASEIYGYIDEGVLAAEIYIYDIGE